MDNYTVLIIEDEPKIIEFIQSYIENAGYNVIIATNGSDAIKSFKEETIDLILLDLMLPDISGKSICKIIRSDSDVPIIMITAKIDEDSIINGLNIGADDYITKPFSPRQLIARIEALFRRTKNKNRITSHLLQIDSLTINSENFTIFLDDSLVQLTPTEFYILNTLASRPLKVFTREELIDIIFDGQYEGYTRSLDSHIKNIRSKISKLTDHDYIITVRGIGYRFGSE